ncbi:monovalent cation/H+ antiporter complex subunit F [Sorangium sp. So ce1335]|uniref:monovalent cation/H+ antiporter complex subunit F n=1 Tax=Sorangium sp. So ce1335 TaxID=3133335 RepID=UPI003F5D9D52
MTGHLPTSPTSAVLLAALVVLGIGMLLCVIRICRGPSLLDKVLAFDCLVLDVVGAVLVLSVELGTALFIDVVLVITLLGFIGTIALVAYVEGDLVD